MHLDGRAVVRASGEIDANTAPQLRTFLATMEASTDGDVVLDVEEVRLVDSAGLGALVGAYKRVKQSGSQLVLRRPNAVVQRVLRVSGLDQVFVIET